LTNGINSAKLLFIPAKELKNSKGKLLKKVTIKKEFTNYFEVKKKGLLKQVFL
jgi:hypothetical protein